MKEKLQNPWARIGVIAAGALVLFIIWYSYFYRPARQRLRELTRQEEMLRQGITGMALNSMEANRLRVQTDSLLRELKSIRARLVEPEQLDELIQKLARRGRSVGMPFVSVVPNYDILLNDSTKGPVLPLPIDIEATGRFFALGRFLDRLQAVGFFFEPTAVGIQYDPAIYPRLKIQISGNLYLRPHQAPADTAGQKGRASPGVRTL